MPGKSLSWWLSGAAALAIVAGMAVTFAIRGKTGVTPRTLAANHANSMAGTLAVGLNSPQSLEDWKKLIGATNADGFAGLFKLAMNISDPALRNQIMTALVTRWMGVDMKGFIAFVDATEVDDSNYENGIWAILAPALMAAMPTLPDEVASRPELNEIVRRMVAYMAQTNPDLALKWAKQWLMDDALESALATVAGEMAKKSPAKALTVLNDIQTSVRRVDAINAIGAAYGESHPAEAVKWAENLPNKVEQPYAVSSVLTAMAKTKPTDAAQEFVGFRDRMIAAYDIERAKDMAALNLKESDPNATEAEKATDFETLPGKDDPQLGLLDDAACAIAENWVAVDPLKAMQWTASLPESRMKDDAVVSAYGAWASEQPQAAYDYYMKNNATDPAPAAPIFEAWAEAAPADAAAQINQLINPALRATAISGVVSGWLNNSGDQQALAAWVDQLPNGRERDIANAEIVDSVSDDQPQVAWNRATTIQNAVQRSEALKSAFANLVENDPVSARNMLAETKNLTPIETSGLTRMLDAVATKTKN